MTLSVAAMARPRGGQVNLVVGAGEVGTAVAEVLGCDVVDVTNSPQMVRDLHICFPWSDRFETEVERYRDLFAPDMIVVHSTVPVGTCTRLGAVHSPVRGRHPHLVEGLSTFVKFFAGVDAKAAAECWPGPVEVVEAAETTEAGKLWELLMFGLAVAQQKEMYRWCEAVGADPEVAYRRFTETYNDGYSRLGLSEVVRPVIGPMPGKIGGHCVIQNAGLIDHSLARLLLELNDKW